jgi:hypothetical protein
MTLADGGIVKLIDIEGAIHKCREKVNRDEDIIIDMIFCTGCKLYKVIGSASIELIDASDYSSAQVFIRSVSKLLERI